MNDVSVRANKAMLKCIHISIPDLDIVDFIRLFTASLFVHVKESLLLCAGVLTSLTILSTRSRI